MINWRDPEKELPKEGSQVWAMYSHWKSNGIMGFQIMGGEVEADNTGKVSRVCSNDYTGHGSWSVYFYDEDSEFDHDDYCLAWVYAEEMPLPEWNQRFI